MDNQNKNPNKDMNTGDAQRESGNQTQQDRGPQIPQHPEQGAGNDRQNTSQPGGQSGQQTGGQKGGGPQGGSQSGRSGERP